jgi:arylsulfatase A-like enzyme
VNRNADNENGSFAYLDFGGTVGRTFFDSDPAWPAESAPGPDQPNVVIVLVDDMGFSDVGCYGGEIETPNIDRLAARGQRLTNFHVTPMCAPTRACLLTGVNHHLAGVADVLYDDPGFPGYLGELREDVVTLPEILQSAGYRTLMVGKWHLAKESHTSAGSPRRSWPLQRGFDEFYGVLGACTNLHHPHQLVDGNSVVAVDAYPTGYYLTDDLTDRAIRMVREHRAHDPVAPFFLHLAHLAVHAPLHAKEEDIAKYAARYERGWDVIRRERYDRLVALGILPEGTELPDNVEPDLDVVPWESLDGRSRAVFARYMAVYAAMVDNIDQNLGRLVAALEEMGEMENTIFMFLSDNGSTHEGGRVGSIHYLDYIAAVHVLSAEAGGSQQSVEDAFDRLDEIGGPRTMPIHPRGWAQVSNTPFRLYKSFTHAGGRQVACIVSWPSTLADRGSLRGQYAHVTDILPTVLEMAGLESPATRNGRPAVPVSGVSFYPMLRNVDAASDHQEQYFERKGNLAYYQRGWEIVARGGEHPGLEAPAWELYHVATDPTEARDVAGTHPDRVEALAAAWERAAWRNQVFPLDDKTGLRRAFRNPGAGRTWGQPVVLYPGTATMSHHRSSQLIGTRSFRIVVRLDHRRPDAGVLVAHGDQGGGYVVYVESGRVHFAHNHRGVLSTLSTDVILQEGPRTITVDVAAPGRWVWDVRLLVDGHDAAHPMEVPMLWGQVPFQGIDVGADRGSPVSWPLRQARGVFPYSGRIQTVTYQPGELAPDSPYRASPEEVRALARAIFDAIQ